MANKFLKKLPKVINDWNSLMKAQNVFRHAEKKEEWVFRGLSDGNNCLETTLERVVNEFSVPSDKIPDLEVKLILEFMRRYHLYAVEPPPRKGDTLDWLALMRHHGAPSRLLDFTFSFLVATYFALERPPKPKGTPTIWAINKSWLTKEVDNIVKDHGNTIASQFDQYKRYRDGNAFRKVFFADKPPTLVSSVSPFRLNQRQTIQQGIFLCPCNVAKTFKENLEAMNNHSENVKKIPINNKARAELLNGLLSANLSSATLFPGLDGFAASLWTRVASLKHWQKMEDNGARSKINLDITTLRRW